MERSRDSVKYFTAHFRRCADGTGASRERPVHGCGERKESKRERDGGICTRMRLRGQGFGKWTRPVGIQSIGKFPTTDHLCGFNFIFLLKMHIFYHHLVLY